jgi:hypothetical protein
MNAGKNRTLKFNDFVLDFNKSSEKVETAEFFGNMFKQLGAKVNGE